MLEYLKKDIETLISKYEKVKEENDTLKKELQEDRATITTYKEQIIELETQIDNLKLRSAFLSSPGDGDAREKIDKMVKEIDRCISLLEK